MNVRVLLLTITCAAMAGCVTPPASEPPARSVSPPVRTSSSTVVLEDLHHERAKTFMREHHWADALVQWELLTLLKPDAQEYRDALTDTRKRIRDAADGLLRAAEQARRQGNLDQATLLYLRVLNVDRENSAAAQALRDIDSERTLRAYINRPPRMAM